MNKNFIKKMKKKLLEEKSLILGKIAVDDKNIDSDGDETDEIQANLLIYVNGQVNSRYKSSIDKINSALSKIDRGEYGVCEECEEEILEKRLEFNPYFSTCISCAEKKERQLRN